MGTRRTHRRVIANRRFISLSSKTPNSTNQGWILTEQQQPASGERALGFNRYSTAPQQPKKTIYSIPSALGFCRFACNKPTTGGNLRRKHQVAHRMGLWAAALRPRFVIDVGDNFNDVGVSVPALVHGLLVEVGVRSCSQVHHKVLWFFDTSTRALVVMNQTRHSRSQKRVRGATGCCCPVGEV